MFHLDVSFELAHLTAWLHQHPHASGLVAFLISFVESLAVVGLFIPGSVTMGAVGTLIGSGIIPATETFIWAITGAFLGDVISYGLGSLCQNRLHTLWPFRNYPKWLEKGELFFNQHGGKSVFLGRFIGPMRPFVPLIAGSLGMPGRRFFPISLVAACGWAPLYMLPGVLLGTYAFKGSSNEAVSLALHIVLATVAVIAILSILKHVLDYILHQYPRLKRYVLFIITLTLFLWLLENVLYQGYLIVWNDEIFNTFASIQTPWLTSLARYITLAGDKRLIIPIFFLIALWLYWRNARLASLYWLSNLLVGIPVAYTLKHWINYPRPQSAAGLLMNNPSFPSGHTAGATVLWISVLMLIMPKLSTRWRWLTYFLCALPPLLVGFSRLYLQVHWVTDVIGGALIAILSTQFVSLVFTRYDAGRRLNVPSPRQFISVTISLLVVSILITYPYFKDMG